VNRRSGLKRTGHKPKVSMAEFWAAVTENGTARCALAVIQADGLSDCAGRNTAHHWIKEQHLPTAAAKTDPRVGVPLCLEHHRDVHSAYPPVVPRPPLLDEFLADWNLLESGRPRPRNDRDAA